MLGKNRDLNDFVMMDRAGVADVVALARSKALLPRDFAVLMALIAGWAHSDNTTLGCSASLAEQLGANRADVVRSLARIRKAGLLVRWQRRRSAGNRCIVNPLFVTAGGVSRRLQHRGRFLSAL
jgi:DNA-binding MarR family transcriptional regulator